MNEPAPSLPAAEGQLPSPELERNRFSWPAAWVVIVSLSAMGAAFAQIAAGRADSGLFIPALSIVVCAVAAWHDAATSRIPNELTYAAILLGLGLNTLGWVLELAHAQFAVRWLGAAGPLQALGGFGLCAGLGLFAMSLAGMGGGDMKLLAAVGALLGFKMVIGVLFFALAAAVAYSLVNLAIAGRLNHAARAIALWFLDLAYLARPQKIVAVQRATIPLAVPLLIGLVLWQTPARNWVGWIF